MRIVPALLAVPLLAQAPTGPFPGRSYRTGVPVPALGAAYTPHPELVAFLQALAAAAPDRVRLTTYNTTEEGRPQLFLAISSPDNLRRLDELRAANARLADPRTVTESQAEAIVHEHPVFVWLGYSIHGSEPAGTEAGLALAYHFAACQDPEVLAQLERTVLLLDLTQNPDGRARHIQAVAESLQGQNPPDPQDAQNQGRWPSGRFNHRLFDLNRDWAWQTQAESRAKAALFLAWNPQVLADLHEMQPERNYFFPPNMLPVHEALAGRPGGTWTAAFGTALATAFDRQGFRYFTREEYDLFYPSYGDTWSSFQGAVGMTFECPNPGGLTYLRKDGELLRLSGRVARHLTASLAAVALAADKRQQLLEDFYRSRRERLQTGDRAGAFILGPGADPGRTLALVRLLQRNGIEVQRTTEPLDTHKLEPIMVGPSPEQAPAGSYLVALDQPRAPLAIALLEKDARMGTIPSYDVTAWSLPLTFNVPAWFAKSRPRLATAEVAEPAQPPLAKAASAYLIPAGIEGRERILEALLRDGFHATAAGLPFTCQGQTFQPGTAIFTRAGNDVERLDARVAELAPTLAGAVVAVASGRMETGPDLGSGRNLTLRAPRVALVIDGPTSPTAVGAVIQTLLDNGIPFTQLRAQRLAGADLHRYSHLILVDDQDQGRGYQGLLGAGGTARLKSFTQDGGVLIAMQGGAAFASRGGLCEAGYGFLARRDEEARLREKDPKHEPPAPDLAERIAPWAGREERELRESAPGVLLRAQVDLSHPLAWGLNSSEAAVQDNSDLILDLSPGGENPIHYPKAELRLAGLLAKELEPRLQMTSYLLREHSGKGAVILFAGDPVFRGLAPFTGRAFLNAIFFGGYTLWSEQ
jgi:hypothetical protein